jgi:hypothetical protein
LAKQLNAAEHIEGSTGRTEPASHARYNLDIRNARYPACHLVRGALGREFDRDGIWDIRWPCRLQRYLCHGPDYGALRFMSGAATESQEVFKRRLPQIPESGDGGNLLAA